MIVDKLYPNWNVIQLTDAELSAIYDAITYQVKEHCDESLLQKTKYPVDRIKAMFEIYDVLNEHNFKPWFIND